MSIEKKEKKKFFDCKSKVFFGLLAALLTLNIVYVKTSLEVLFMVNLFVQITGFGVFIYCIYNEMKTKEYGIAKKIGVWLLQILFVLFLSQFAAAISNQVLKGLMAENMQMTCDAPLVKTNVENTTKSLLVDNKIVTPEDVKKVTLSLSNIKEVRSKENTQKQVVECRAILKIENVLDTPLVYTMDYNSSYDTETMQVQSSISLTLQE